MASMAISHLILYSVLFLSCNFLNRPCVVGARQLLANHQHVNPEMKFLLPASTCLTPAKGEKIVHKYESCSPMEKSKLNSHMQILPQDEFGQLKSIEVANEYGEGIRLTLNLADNDDFLVTVGFGTPKSEFNLIFDTGSDLTWIQCQPCSPTDCNHQLPIFDPSSSSTFSNVTCPNACSYTKSYHDGSYSSGYYANDTLSITSDLYRNFIFGCAHKIVGNNFGEAAGLLGVGPGQYSLVAQTDVNFFSLFCYCLPATQSSTGFIVFGVQAYETCQPDDNKMIPIVAANQNQNSLTDYFVTLTSITIGQQKLNMFSSLKVIIDSGTVITRLPPSVYSVLQSAFRELMAQYPVASPLSKLLDTCYNLKGHNNWTPPEMVLHFEAYEGSVVDVPLESSAVTLTENADNSKVCLAFAANEHDDDLTIIGNKQHRALNLFFDIHNHNMTFGSGCSNF